MPESTSSKKTSTVLEAMILALLIHAILLIVFYFSDLGMFSFRQDNPPQTNQADMEFIELTEELFAIAEVPEEDEIESLLDKYKNVTSKDGSTQNSEIRSYSFNKGKIDDQVREDLLKMEREEFEKLKREGIIPEEVNQKDLEGAKEAVKEGPVNKDSNPNSNSYSAATSNYDFSRNHELKKDPAYKCRLFGQIVVEITVNRDGQVMSAKGIKGDLHKDCLLEESVNYAKRWKFESKFDAPRSEKGTITFTFLPQ